MLFIYSLQIISSCEVKCKTLPNLSSNFAFKKNYFHFITLTFVDL